MKPKGTLEEFNAECEKQVKSIYLQLHAAGHKVTPDEAKFLFVLGWCAIGELVGADNTPLMETAREIAKTLPKVAKPAAQSKEIEEKVS